MRELKDELERAVQRTGWSGIYQCLPDTRNNVLMYHSIGGSGHANISAELFRRHLEWLQKTYKIVDLPKVLAGDGGKQIALTFDDGYRSFYDIVLPILREYSVPATLFVMGKPLSDKSFVHDDAPPEYRRYLSKRQLQEIADSPRVTIGNHSMSHLNLSKSLPQSTLREEIVDSKRLLESELGVPINRFCYPGNNWSQSARDVVATTHECAVRGVGGRKFVTSEVDPYLIPRVDGAVPLPALRFEVSDSAKLLRRTASRVLSGV